MVERNVVEGLNRLEDLIADAQRRKARAQDGGAVPVPYVFISIPKYTYKFTRPEMITIRLVEKEFADDWVWE